MISRLSIIMKSRLNRKSENFVQIEFEVANHPKIEAWLTLGRFCLKFLELLGFYKSAGTCYPLATDNR